MSGLLIVVVSGALLLGAYFLYGGWLCKVWGVDPNRATPAVELRDGVDYVPAPKSVLFGHQFASIAGAGPINGPIMAAMFGWGPVLAWILLGSIFFGAVQDFSSLYASVRSKGKGLGLIIEEYVGKTGKTLFLLFCWLFCILVVAAFADIVAGTFNGFNADGSFNDANGATATTSVLFIVSAVMFALFLYKKRSTGIINALVAIALLTACITLGIMMPMHIAKTPWLYIVFAYIFLAAVAPVWVLLQPRDYLNSYLLLFMIGAAAVGIVFTNPTVTLPPYLGFTVNGQSIFPILFVTVACGAVSGFHSLVSSGTTSKQLSNERDMRLIGFGSMLLEGFLAVIALVAVGALYNNGLPKGTPPIIFANGVSGFLAELGLPVEASRTLLTLAVSAFALTSLDSVARIGRLSFQELVRDTNGPNTGWRGLLSNTYVATLLTLILGYLLALGGYQNIWALFGSSNQLLGALALIAVCVFMKRTGRNCKMLIIPMIAMLAITLSALGLSVYNLVGKLNGAGEFLFLREGLQLIFAILLMGLAAVVSIQSFRVLGSASATSQKTAVA
ncbi:MAG: carbon starvation protein A [Desulfovibrionaceae bacterium]|nr:carbon starvation protein A [Desulfovibrionaceae bacterium]